MKEFYNHMFLECLPVPRYLWQPLPHLLMTWLRNYIAATLVYLITSFLWSFYIYHLRRNIHIRQDAIPSTKNMILQISVSMKGLPWFSVVPTLAEYLIENGWTKCFLNVDEVGGWLAYSVYTVTYLVVVVEFTTYWAHRGLHDIKFLYRYIHAQHHSYNKKDTLSPFAGLALDPVDGIVEAMPHVVALVLVPIHFRTQIALVFIEVLWTTNIHDCVDAKMWPVMGAAYHMMHHTSYRHNYGHFTVFMDWLFGTLCDPGSGTTKNYKFD